MAVLLLFFGLFLRGSERLAQDQLVNKYVLKSRLESSFASFTYLYFLAHTCILLGGKSRRRKGIKPYFLLYLLSKFLLNIHRLKIVLPKELLLVCGQEKGYRGT